MSISLRNPTLEVSRKVHVLSLMLYVPAIDRCTHVQLYWIAACIPWF